MIELRSDTFTLPTPAMREAAFYAQVGDDVYGEDPTVNRLERLAADMLGKEAACFMPSGTMANLTSILVHCPRGTEVLVGDESDIYHYEAGGASVVGGIIYHAVPTRPDGTLPIPALAQAIRDASDSQFAEAALICLENTHNRCGGVVLPLAYLAEVQRFARERGLPVHIDGARIFNAAVALGVRPAEIAQYADSVQFCLSKGLAAPVGSLVVGDRRFVERARRLRKMLGGGMRQVGMMAAAGIVALETMVGRLVEDHANARRLAEGLAQIPGLRINLETVQTNIVIFEVLDDRYTWQSFLEALSRHGVRMGELGYGRIRAVTHYGISADDVDLAIEAVRRILA
ncbi:MAG: threonine aldolase [Herpetosiphonaceae bacterium]|nr:MAG: threonine aldolase [Herpetosiphonaceae bacterium]